MRGALVVDTGVFLGAGAAVGVVQALQATNLDAGTQGIGLIVQRILLQGAHRPVREFTVRVLPAVQGLVIGDGFHVLLVETFQDHAHAPGSLGAGNTDVDNGFHLLAPAFGGEEGVRNHNGFHIIVDDAVVEVGVVFLAIYAAGRRPAVFEHHHAAGVVEGVTQIGGLVFLRFGKFDGGVAGFRGGGNLRVDDGVVQQGNFFSVNLIGDIGHGRDGGDEGKVNLAERIDILSVVGNDHLRIYRHFGRGGLSGSGFIRNENRLGADGHNYVVVTVIVASVRFLFRRVVTAGDGQNGDKSHKQQFEQIFHFEKNCRFVFEILSWSTGGSNP